MFQVVKLYRKPLGGGEWFCANYKRSRGLTGNTNGAYVLLQPFLGKQNELADLNQHFLSKCPCHKNCCSYGEEIRFW